MQFTDGPGYSHDNLWFYLLCNWKTAATLLYKPIDENERKMIDEIVKVKKAILHQLKSIFNSEMQCVFDSQNKRTRLFNLLRNQVNHRNSIFIFHFLPRRSKLDKIGQRFLLETNSDEIFESRSSKCDEKRS